MEVSEGVKQVWKNVKLTARRYICILTREKLYRQKLHGYTARSLVVNQRPITNDHGKVTLHIYIYAVLFTSIYKQ